jgi:polar amino acid transport system substrate-binding protein
VRCRVGPLLAVLLLALPFGPLPRVSARSLEDIEGRGAISLCAHPNALPFASRRGPVHGVQIDLADELAKRLGVGLKVEWVTVGLQYRAVDCDIVMDTIVEEDALQERDLRWSTPYQRSGVALALRPGGDAIERFEDLGPEARVGVQLGSLAQWLLGRQGLKTIPFGFEDEMVAALASGEIDAAAATPTSIGWYNHEHPEAKLVIAHAADHEPELAWDLAVGMRRSDRGTVKLAGCGAGPGRIGGYNDDAHPFPLHRPPLSAGSHRPRRLALLPVPARPAHGRGDAGRPRHRRQPRDGTVKLTRERMKKCRSSSTRRSYAAALAPATSAQITKACARAVRYAVAVT